MINIDKGVSIILHDWLNVRKDEMIHFITDETHLREAEAMERWAYGADAALKTTILNSQLVQKGDVIEAMNRGGVKVDIVSDKDFTEAFTKALSDEKLSESVSPLISYQASDKNTIEFFIDYDNTFTTKALYRLNFKWPIINETYLENVFDALATLAFFDEV